MYTYNDYNYVNYVIGSNFVDGYKLFRKCQERQFQDCYKIDRQMGYDKDYDIWKKEMTNQGKKVDSEDIESEEERILKMANRIERVINE